MGTAASRGRAPTIRTRSLASAADARAEKETEEG